MRIKSIVFTAILPLIGMACDYNNVSTESQQQKQQSQFHQVVASGQTAAVASSFDAADDLCVWYDEKAPENSRIIGTNKQKGLEVYNLKGEKLYDYPVGRVNNVDLRYGYVLQDDTFAIVGATNRSFNSVSLFRVADSGRLISLSIDQIISKTEEVYGFCMYRSPQSGKFYANLVAKDGAFEQYELKNGKLGVEADLVRTFLVGGQAEGMVADDELADLFIGEENHGIWKYGAEPEDGDNRSLVADLSNKNLQDDIEGLCIYYAANEAGYLIASSQGNHSYAVFQRQPPHVHLGNFQLVDGPEIDGTYDTDGIDVLNLSLGPKYPNGIFIAQDGANTHRGDSLNQNFKMANWEAIARSFRPALTIDSSYRSGNSHE